jgi:hypothetical protein
VTQVDSCLYFEFGFCGFEVMSAKVMKDRVCSGGVYNCQVPVSYPRRMNVLHGSVK